MFLLQLILMFALCQISLTANIILISNVPSHSHSLWYTALAKFLAENGHKISLLDTDPLREKMANVTHYELSGGYSWNSTNFDDFIEIQKTSIKTTLELTNFWTKILCNSLLTSRGVEDFLKNSQLETYDLLIMDFACESFASLSYKFGNIPIIWVTAYQDPINILHNIGNYENPAYCPFQLTNFKPIMNFKDRLINTAITMYADYLNKDLMKFESENARKLLGNGMPDLEKIISENSRAAFINTHFTMKGVKPLLPNVIPIAGFHIEQRKPKIMEKDLQNFLDNSKQPVIYFSLGTNIKSEYIGEEKINMFIDVFKELPYKILWKLESPKTDLPPNIKIAKWFSQSDVLAHPKVKLFISHCGELGIQEAIFHGKPILGMPFFIDQLYNSEKLVDRKVAIELDFKTLTAQKVKNTIKELIENPTYEKNMKELSSVYTDDMNTASDKILFWVNYTLRHPNGKFLKSPTLDLNWCQLYLLDIQLFLIGCLFGLLFIIYFIVNLFCKIFCTIKKNYKKKID